MWGWLGEDKDRLTAFGASSSAGLVVGLVELDAHPTSSISDRVVCAWNRSRIEELLCVYEHDDKLFGVLGCRAQSVGIKLD